jgi:hypothetical protein
MVSRGVLMSLSSRFWDLRLEDYVAFIGNVSACSFAVYYDAPILAPFRDAKCL